MRVSFRLPARLDHRPIAMEIVAVAAARVTSSNQEFRDAIATAFGEAFNNVVFHAYRGRDDGELAVEVDFDDKRIELRLQDEGIPADYEKVKPPNLDEMPEQGMGIFMMYSLLDTVVYRPGPPNQLTLAKAVT